MRTRPGRPAGPSRPRLSIVTPALDEAANLPALAARLRPVLDGLGLSWEWIIVDDGSRDGTFAAIEQLAREDSRIAGVRLARNVGSHAALICGLERARGDAAVTLAADLADPPEIVPALLAAWDDDTHVVWAVRRERRDVGAARRLASRIESAEALTLAAADLAAAVRDERPPVSDGRLGLDGVRALAAAQRSIEKDGVFAGVAEPPAAP